MNSETINPQLGQEFRKYITAPEARKAFDLLIARSAHLREFRCQFKLKGAVRDFRYYDAVSGEQPYSCIINRNSLLFYVRKPGFRRLKGGPAGLARAIPDASENNYGEIKIRLGNERDTLRLVEYLFPSSASPQTEVVRPLSAPQITSLQDIVSYWSEQRANPRGQWLHPADQDAFEAVQHTFNLDYPVSPYVGDILNAPVIILGANAGYDSVITPEEFPDTEAIERYVSRVRLPSESDWSVVSSYYDRLNYGPLLATGQVALINACPYRSRKISEEPENRRLLKNLPSTAYARRWLLESVLPLVNAGQRLLVAKRPGLWDLPAALRNADGVVFDPAPVSPQLTSTAWEAVQQKVGLRS